MARAAEQELSYETVPPLPRRHDERWFAAAAFGAAATAVGAAVQRRDGLFDPPAFIALTLALVAAAAPFLFARPSGAGRLVRLRRLGPRGAAAVLGAGVAFQFFEFFTYSRPGSWHADSDFGVRANPLFHAALAAAALGVVAMFLFPRRARILSLAPVGAFVLIGLWIIRAVPVPVMDVWVVQTEGVKAFLRGHNPFAIAFPDIYHHPDLYAPGAVRDGLVHLGFPYPPLVLLMDLPGFLLGGDFRYSNVAAVALAAVLISWARPAPREGHDRNRDLEPREERAAALIGPLAAVLFLFTPRVFLVIESGWTEPSTVLLLALLAFCGGRFPKAVPAVLGLFLVSKQYLLFAVAPAWLLLREPRQDASAPPATGLPAAARVRRFARLLGVAVLVGSAVSLPLIAWDVRAFLESNFMGAARTPFRRDALSYLALYANARGAVPPPGLAAGLGFAAALGASALVLRRGRRGAGGYAGAVGFIYLAFFALNKFAFCNYYYLILAAFCIAAGAAGVGGGEITGAGVRDETT